MGTVINGEQPMNTIELFFRIIFIVLELGLGIAGIALMLHVASQYEIRAPK